MSDSKDKYRIIETVEVRILNGPATLREWQGGVKAVASAKHLTILIFQDTEDLLQKPTVPNPVLAKQSKSEVDLDQTIVSNQLSKNKYDLDLYNANLKAYDQQQTRIEAAKLLLYGALAEDIRTYVVDLALERPCDIYQKIIELYQIGDQRHANNLMDRILQLKFSDTRSATDFVNKLRMCSNELKAIDAKKTLPDIVLTRKIILSLPSQFKEFVTVYERLLDSNDSDSSLETLTTKLIEYDEDDDDEMIDLSEQGPAIDPLEEDEMVDPEELTWSDASTEADLNFDRPRAEFSEDESEVNIITGDFLDHEYKVNVITVDDLGYGDEVSVVTDNCVDYEQGELSDDEVGVITCNYLD